MLVPKKLTENTFTSLMVLSCENAQAVVALQRENHANY